MTYALLIVDVQYDFLPGGALGLPNGDSILLPIRNMAHNALRAGGRNLIIASRDWHPENHFSFSDDPRYLDQSWPPHCVQGTKGARIHPSVRKYADYVISKGMNRNEEAYSVFQGKTLRPVRHLEEILDESGVDTVVVCGLALDVCVRYTALDANALGYKTIVPLDSTVGLNDDSIQETLDAFLRAGVHTPGTFDASQ